MKMATPHIESKKEDIAKTVLMPGDPLRAKMIAEKYLENPVLVNSVRNILAYTGTYKGKRVTVFSSGMGNPSMGIYSYELFNEYDVDEIIRIGSCGAFREDLNLYEVLLVENSYSVSNYLQELTGEEDHVLPSNIELNKKLENAANRLRVNIHHGNVFCTDVFYNQVAIPNLRDNYNCYATEMETFALFSNARKLNKKASAILTVSDNLNTKEVTTSEERQNSFNKMVEIALESII
ncbi:MAG: purine-nucleoside phosphorylase [Bacilli bacterium]|nr:purine-nucleoside phosphorylase [Bacilli bacterium]